MHLPMIGTKYKKVNQSSSSRCLDFKESSGREFKPGYWTKLLHSNEKDFRDLFGRSKKTPKRFYSQRLILDPQLSTIKHLRSSPETIIFPILVKTVKFAPYHSPDFFASKKKSKVRLVSNF
jgi:hypothetical protein